MHSAPTRTHTTHSWKVDGTNEGLLDYAKGLNGATNKCQDFNTDYSGFANRLFKTGNVDEYKCGSTCPAATTTVPVTKVTLALNNKCGAAKACASVNNIGGEWWNTCTAAVLKDGKFTVEVPENSGGNTEYFWTVDGANEGLLAYVKGGGKGCDATSLNTDSNNYANRIFKAGVVDEPTCGQTCPVKTAPTKVKLSLSAPCGGKTAKVSVSTLGGSWWENSIAATLDAATGKFTAEVTTPAAGANLEYLYVCPCLPCAQSSPKRRSVRPQSC